MLSALEASLEGLIEIFYPPTCQGCSRGPLPGGPLLCDRCLEVITGDVERRCWVCAHPLHRPGPLCLPCVMSRPSFVRALCLGGYGGPLRRAIHAFKFQGNQTMGRLLGELLAGRVYREIGAIDRVIPVPAAPRREAQRGFSPTRVLAREVARHGGLGRESEVLRRVGGGMPMTGRSRLDRQLEILESYQLEPGVDLWGQRVLLIDDVLTTGATARNLSFLLRHQGMAREVYVAVLARTVGEVGV